MLWKRDVTVAAEILDRDAGACVMSGALLGLSPCSNNCLAEEAALAGPEAVPPPNATAPRLRGEGTVSSGRV
jgi:hypothetical protein